MDDGREGFGAVSTLRIVEDAIEQLKGVACVCASLALSADGGRSRYAGSEMSLLCGVVETAIDELERVIN